METLSFIYVHVVNVTLFQNVQHEWHCIAQWCWCAVKNLLTNSLKHENSGLYVAL